MGRVVVLCPQFSPLRHSETVLFVNDGESEIAELHCFLYHGMSTDENIDFSSCETFKYCLAPLALYYACKQFDTQVETVQERLYRSEMLLCEDFCRSHHAGLKTVIHGNKHGHQCYESLSGAYVSLHQTVHLSAGIHVCLYLMHDSFLRPCQFKPKVLLEKVMEMHADSWQKVASVLASVVGSVAENVELNVEQFLKLQSLSRFLHLMLAVRVVYSSDSLIA